MVNEWQKSCSHLVMDALSFTVKVCVDLFFKALLAVAMKSVEWKN